MPELPEVETIMNGLKPHVQEKKINDVILRHHQLRWPIPTDLKDRLKNQVVRDLSRRGKYLLMNVNSGTLIIHLGMSGRLQLINSTTPANRHDHMDLVLNNQTSIRYTDPRRFGALLWTNDTPLLHPLLKSLGIEPLEPTFTTSYLLQHTSSRRVAVKTLIMDSKIIVGVGNIYAAEALFLAGLHPLTPTNLLTIIECERLVAAIKYVLKAAIKQGGTTLKDFVNSDGKPGYFKQKLAVYGRAGQPCIHCNTPLESFKLGQRSTVFCISCQPENR